MRRWIALALLLLLPITAAAQGEDIPGAFGDWFLSQEWTDQQIHAWGAVFGSLMDGRNRSPEPVMPILDPVYVAIVSGTKYHTDKKCASLGNAYKVVEMDKAEANERGFEMCKRCEKL